MLSNKAGIQYFAFTRLPDKKKPYAEKKMHKILTVLQQGSEIVILPIF